MPLPDLRQAPCQCESQVEDRIAIERALREIDRRLAEALAENENSALPARFESAVPAGSAAPASSSSGERRAFPRRESGCVVSVYQPDGQTAVSEQRLNWLLHSSQVRGQLVDISMNGIAFVLNEPIAANAAIYLRLANRRLDLQHDLSAHVLRSVAEEDGQWKIVCQLERKLSYELVSAFGKNLFQSAYV